MEHKARSVIVASGVFLGLLFPLRLPEYFWHILAAVSVAAAFSSFWIFNEKPSLDRAKKNWFVIVFVAVFVASLGTFAYTLQHPFFQALVLGSTGFFVFNILQVASRVRRGYKPSLVLRNIVNVASMLVVFFSVSNLSLWLMASEVRWERFLAVLLVFLSVFLVCEFSFEIQGYERPVLYSLVISFVITQVVWLSSFWIIAYPYSEKAAGAGVPLPAIIASVYFYLFWGLSYHRLEDKLTRRILWEYILIAVFFTAILILTADWAPTDV